MQGVDETQARAAVELALERIRTRNISAALEQLLIAADYDAEDVRIINLVASCYYSLGEFDRARACWERALEIDEVNREARDRLSSLQEPNLKFWIKRYREVLSGVENRNYGAAIETLQGLMAENDGFVNLYQLLGLCYLAQGDREQAVKIWQKGLELDQGNAPLLSYLSAQVQAEPVIEPPPLPVKKERLPRRFRAGWAIAGVVAFALLVQMATVWADSRASKMTIDSMQQRIVELTRQLEYKDQGRDKVIPTSNLGFSDNARGEEDEMAGSIYDDEKEEEYYSKGYQAYLKGDRKSAISNLGVVVSINSNDFRNREALYYLARTYMLDKDYAAAERYYQKYLKQFPDTHYCDDVYYYLGCIYHQQGKEEAAHEAFVELKKLEPTSGYLSSPIYRQVMES